MKVCGTGKYKYFPFKVKPTTKTGINRIEGENKVKT